MSIPCITATPTDGAAMGEIPREICSLKKNLGNLTESVQSLLTRLDLVTSPPTPSPDAAPIAARTTGIGASIGAVADEIQLLHEKVCNQMSRLEL